MATKTDAGEQVKFLVSCISHTNNGRPDFTAVAEDLGIVSKAAAQKRYERMLKANNVIKKPATPGDGPKATPRKKRAAVAEDDDTETKPTPKKRAGRTPKKESSSDGDETKLNTPVKARRALKAKPVKKEEPESDDSKESKESEDSKEEDKEEEEEAQNGQANKENGNARESSLSDAPPSGEESPGAF